MKTGLLGGTFNPVHIGHLRLALEVGETLGLDRVELIPAKVPPHKSDEAILPFELRADLLDLAVEQSPLLRVNRVEKELPVPSYTYDTLVHLNKTRPEDEFYFITGVEGFMEFPTWHRWEEIPLVANLVVADRGGYDLDRAVDTGKVFFLGEKVSCKTWPTIKIRGGKRIIFLPVPKLEISSTEIREKWLAGRDLSWLVPETVLAGLAAGEKDVHKVWG